MRLARNKKRNVFPAVLPLILAGVLASLPVPVRADTVPHILEKMIRRTRSVRTLHYTIKKWERIDSGLFYEENEIKLNRRPFQVYLRQITPRKGLELLYRQGVNQNHILIHPNGPPYINLNFSVDHSQVRKNQHHNIHAMGFDHIAGIIEYILHTGKKELHYEPPRPERWNGREGLRIVFYTPHFRFRQYRVREGENIIGIARRLHLSEYMILTNNPSLSGYDDVTPGETIQVPASYAKRTELFLDRETGLPLAVRIYDNRGLFEKYEYHSFRLNPSLPTAAFSPENDAYGF